MTETVTVSMDRTLKDLLDNYCEHNRCGRSEVIRRALMQHISPGKPKVATSEKKEQPKEIKPGTPEKTSKPLDVAEKVRKIIEEK